jgi:hypothetical protein
MGVEPDQVPVEAVSVWPTVGVPEIVGKTDDTGADVTTAVAAERAVEDPSLLVAVTLTRIVEPASAEDRTYVAEVAPEIGLQLSPELSQRAQAYV